MLNGNDNLRDKLIHKNPLYGKIESMNGLSHIKKRDELTNKINEDEINKKFHSENIYNNISQPHHYLNNIEKNLDKENSCKHNVNNNKESKLETFQNVSKLSRKRIAPLERKNSNVNKSKYSNDFMSYINKTIYQDSNKKFRTEQYNQVNNTPNLKNISKEKFPSIKSMNDLDSNTDFIDANSPSNMKKTLFSLSLNRSNAKSFQSISTFFNNNNSINNQNKQDIINNNNINNLFTNNFLNINNNNNNSPSNLRMLVNTTNTLNNNIAQMNLNQINNNSNFNPNSYYNANLQVQTTKFLFDNSNLAKFNNAERAKYASKPAGIISSFGVNTHFGNVRYINIFSLEITMKIV